MAEMISIKKPEKYAAGSFSTFSKPGFVKLISRTKKKNVIILWVLLASNKGGFNIIPGKANLMGLFGIPEGLASEISRKEFIQELKDIGFINENNEFNENGWDNEEKVKEEEKNETEGKEEDSLEAIRNQISALGF